MNKKANRIPDEPLMTLSQPIARGEEKISTIHLNKPKVKQLKGIPLSAVLQLEIDAVSTLLTRITQPALAQAEIENLDAVDFTKLSVTLLNFFVGPDVPQS